MSRNPHDQFAKQFLEELLAPFGRVELSREILGEARWVDLWFQPEPQQTPNRPSIDLGLLGTLTQAPCLLELYRNPPDFEAVRSCVSKRLAVVADRFRQVPAPIEAELPQLWLLVPTLSPSALAHCGAIPARNLPQGCYSLPPIFGTHFVVIHKLPKTPDTLWLRLLGKGRCQREAVREILALPSPNPRRDLALELLVNWKIALDTIAPTPSEEEETLMALHQAYLEWEQKTRRLGELEGEQRGIQIGEQRGIQIGEQQQRHMVLELAGLELELKFGEPGRGLAQALEAVEGLADLYELAKALKRLTTWAEVRSWWGDRLPVMMATGDRLEQWLGVALRLQLPAAEEAEIDRLQQDLKALPWEAARAQVWELD